MQIAAVAVSATDLSRAVAFYELLGFRFPPLEPGENHVEAEAGVRLMIDDAAFLGEVYGEPPLAGNTAGFALLMETPAEVDAGAGRVPQAGIAVIPQPYDAQWCQRYATVADPDGYRTHLFCLLPS